ncbi:MAG: PaaI family thioesterase [Candidatus Rokubacteria bacterium]|jgi:acyl-coenzyme A thioesterase PaaI-like protein|nr:PaaI family thioesterase [Candidatus Rokubacteria bacterium]
MGHDSPVPEAFVEAFRDLEELRYTGPRTTFHNCFGCGPHHPIGLRVRCFKSVEGVLSPILIPERFAGPPGAAHGGIVAGYLDEVLAGAAVRHDGRIYLTGELTVRYVKPVPVETPLLGRGRVVQDHGKYLDLEGALEDYRSRAVLALARGRFLPIRTEGA